MVYDFLLYTIFYCVQLARDETSSDALFGSDSEESASRVRIRLSMWVRISIETSPTVCGLGDI